MSKKSSLLEYMAGHPTAANLLMIIFLFMGFLTIKDLRRETFPDFTPTEVEIQVKYPGATAEDVENMVCRRVEDALDGVSNVEEIRSEARENLGRIIAKMREGADIDRFFSDVKTEVEAIDNFPDEVEKPVVTQLGQTNMVVSVAVTGPMSVPHLKIFCEQVKDRMQREPEISQVELKGFSDHQIRIEIPAEKLRQYGLSVQGIAEKVQQQSLDLPAGAVETRDTDILVRFADERRSIIEFQDLIVISGESGSELRLGDLARITDRFDLEEDKILINGKRGGLLTINKTKSEDALRIMDAVKAFLEKERQTAPPGVEYIITQNVSKIVRDRLDMLVVNGLQGFVLVFLTMWLFFSFRFSFWVAMGLPVSFMAALFCMNLIDFSLNMLTMVGLLLAIGLLMDDAIVISENVASHMQRGKNSFDAAVEGTRQVGPGILSSFLTTICVFGPAAFLIEGNIGKVMWVMPVVLILTLSVSLVEAFLILPNHLAHSLRNVDVNNPGRFRGWFDQKLDWFRENVVGRVVDWAISWRYLFMGLVFTVFLGTLAMPAGGLLKFQAFPDLDGDVLQARILLPQGTPLARTEAVVDHVVEALDKLDRELTPLQPEGAPLVENINIIYNLNQDAYEAGPHVATVSVDLLNAEIRTATIDRIAARWRELVGKVPDILNITYKQPAMGPAGLAIDIRLEGDDLDQLKSASLELMDWLNSYEGVLDLNDDLRPGKPEIRYRLKKGASVLGVDASTVARQLRSAFYGIKAGEIQVGAESYDIEVRLSQQDQDSLTDLENFYITTRSGQQIPLDSVVEKEIGRGAARIARINSRRTVTIQGDVDTRVANGREIIQETKKKFLPELIKRYPGINFSLEGEAKETQKTMRSLIKALAIGVFGVFVLLSFQFKSYLEPIVVMTAIPLALIGVIWGHFLMGKTLSMPSIMGFVSLAGVVVNDSILLVEFIKIGRREGKSLLDASGQASRLRFRAILLTSLTTIMGLTPLLMERSLQAQILIPLAISLVFGLMASTVLILIVVPVLYNILADFGLTTQVDPEKH